jgi:DNA-binding MarR family transcriptional regulator
VTADQFVCLVLLSKQDGITQQELARLASSDPNTIRAMLMLLEKRGYVAREKHPTDGRARRVTLTRLGRKIFQDLLATIEPLHDRLSGHLSETAVRGLNDSLRQVHEAMTTKPMNTK